MSCIRGLGEGAAPGWWKLSTPPLSGLDSPPAGLRPYELTTATASISIMKSGAARRVTPTVVLVGVATPK